MTDFRHEKSFSADEDNEVSSHDDSGEDSGEGEKQTPQPKRLTPTGPATRSPEIVSTR